MVRALIKFDLVGVTQKLLECFGINLHCILDRNVQKYQPWPAKVSKKRIALSKAVYAAVKPQ